MLANHQELYVPQDERTLRRLQRTLGKLDKQVRAWADSVMEALPRGLTLVKEEYDLLALYLAQQRRRNLEMDEQDPEETVRTRLGRLIPFVAEDEMASEVNHAAHRMVSTRLDSEIDRITDLVCRINNLPGLGEPVLDWRVAIRYLAQRLYHVASQIDLRRELATSPLRFELALTTRDLAADIVDKRRRMLALFEPAQAQSN